MQVPLLDGVGDGVVGGGNGVGADDEVVGCGLGDEPDDVDGLKLILLEVAIDRYSDWLTHAEQAARRIGRICRSTDRALAVSNWIEAQTGWSIRKFVPNDLQEALTKISNASPGAH